MAKLVDLFIDAGIFLDVGVGGGNVGFWLVVIIVTHEIGDGVVGKNSLNSLHSCAANVLLCAIIKVGRFNFAITCAAVNVFLFP